ncbi:MAG: hypothetical protein JRD19_03270 [Deltaproteobacteria bacterium]|jgi:hypothetical protein|nr:hypothetical protein [Deltaproteobacteria bacterium]
MTLITELLLMTHVACLLILIGKKSMVIRKSDRMVETRINNSVTFLMTVRTDWPSLFQLFRVDWRENITGALFGGTGIYGK